ncbi:MAG: sulfotransferase [Planctomycetota bacterium]|nr:sulfotransferase [Planctomycetota bacterium]
MSDVGIVIVSGLPRSGTSLMMQMLAGGGLEAMTDNTRAADVDNPRGYYELEQVKSIKRDASWLNQAVGKVFKMVSLLLYDLPADRRYRVIFVERNLDEILASQGKMLQRLGRPAGNADEMRRSFTTHLVKLNAWLGQQGHIDVLRVGYHDLLASPLAQAERINQFLGGALDTAKMAAAVDPSLYRNRKQA